MVIFFNQTRTTTRSLKRSLETMKYIFNILIEDYFIVKKMGEILLVSIISTISLVDVLLKYNRKKVYRIFLKKRKK
jgi:hypothetical protein